MLLASPLAATGGEIEEPCELRHRAAPRVNIADPAPLVLGDSVMWFAVEPLAELGFRADAKGCRMYHQGRRMLERMRARGALPRHVVMALGTNWEIPMREIELTLPVVEGRHRLFLVTPRHRRGEPDRDAETIREAARRYPRKVGVLDWKRYSRGKRGWFGSDGLHVTRKGRDAYVRCIKQALPRYRDAGHSCSPD